MATVEAGDQHGGARPPEALGHHAPDGGAWHQDRLGREWTARVHILLTTTVGSMVWMGEHGVWDSYKLRVGTAYLFNPERQHSSHNLHGSEARIHLIVNLHESPLALGQWCAETGRKGCP